MLWVRYLLACWIVHFGLMFVFLVALGGALAITDGKSRESDRLRAALPPATDSYRHVECQSRPWK